MLLPFCKMVKEEALAVSNPPLLPPQILPPHHSDYNTSVASREAFCAFKQHIPPKYTPWSPLGQSPEHPSPTLYWCCLLHPMGWLISLYVVPADKPMAHVQACGLLTDLNHVWPPDEMPRLESSGCSLGTAG